jgi:hypothetical protein
MQRGVIGNTQIAAEPDDRRRKGHDFFSSPAGVAGTRKDFPFCFSEGKPGFLCRNVLSSADPKKFFLKK